MSTLSVALIVKDVAAYIEPCLRSVEKIADEFVIVDTGSSDGSVAAMRAILAGRNFRIVETSPATHPALFMVDDPKLAELGVPPPFTGKHMLADFAGARQIGWDLCTSDYVLWIDSDDVVAEAEKLPAIVAAMGREGIDTLMLPYDYAQDNRGNVTCKLMRERIIRRLGPARWSQPVHEVLSPAGNAKVIEDGPRIVHRRHEIATVKSDVPHRNLKILLTHYAREVAKAGGDESKVDARLFFYVGMELRYVAPEKALRFYDLHAKHSGWDEEKSVSRCWRGEILETQGKLHEAFAEYSAAHFEYPERPDPIFRLSRNAYFRADWVKCIEYAERGWKLMREMGSRPSVIQFDPMERELMPFVFASVAYLRLGRAQEALDCCNKGLKIRPDEPHLLGNKQTCEKILSDLAPPPSMGPAKVDFKFSDPLDGPPTELAPQLEAMFAIHLWKRLRAEGAYDKAASLLDALPMAAGRISKIEEARQLGKLKRAVAVATAPSSFDKLDVLIWAGPAWEDWSPLSLDTTGIGGSETAAVHVARELAARGHRVRVLNQCGPAAGMHDGVEYIDFNAIFQKQFDADVFVSSRQPDIFTENYHGFPPKVSAKARVLWVHDVHCGQPTPQLEAAIRKADRIFCLSGWHKGFFAGTYPSLDPRTIHVTRNSVDMRRFAAEPVKLGNRLIYASSPDRGLLRLLELLPRIRERVPDAELHVYYGFDTWELMAGRHGNAVESQRISAFKQLLTERAGLGVVNHGRVNQRELAEAYLASKVLSYPTWFSETSCQLAGSLIFTKDGVVPIEDVRVGDLVLTHKGRFRRVTQLVRKRYSGALYSVKRKKDFNPITLTEEHPLYAGTFHKRGDSRGSRVPSTNKHARAEWRVPATLVPRRDHLLSPRMAFGERTSVLISDYIDMPVIGGRIGRNHANPRYKTTSNEIVLTPEVMYLLGLFAAEGCVSSSRRSKMRWFYSAITFAMHAREMAKAERVVEFFGGGKITRTSPNGLTINCCHSPWANFLKATIGTGRKKRIPPFVWDCPKDLQAAFVKGAFEGDGSTNNGLRGNGKVRKDYRTYVSISPSLAYGMAQLLANQGHYPGIHHDDKRRAYTLSWTEDPRCVQHWEMSDGFATRVQEVTKRQYEGEVFNFEVEEDRSYVTDRTIVHNCITAMEAQAAGCIPVTTALAALNETVKHGVLIQPPETTEEYATAFVKSVCEFLINEPLRASCAANARAMAKRTYGWVGVAAEWEASFKEILRSKARGIVLPAYGDEALP